MVSKGSQEQPQLGGAPFVLRPPGFVLKKVPSGPQPWLECWAVWVCRCVFFLDPRHLVFSSVSISMNAASLFFLLPLTQPKSWGPIPHKFVCFLVFLLSTTPKSGSNSLEEPMFPSKPRRWVHISRNDVGSVPFSCSGAAEGAVQFDEAPPAQQHGCGAAVEGSDGLRWGKRYGGLGLGVHFFLRLQPLSGHPPGLF